MLRPVNHGVKGYINLAIDDEAMSYLPQSGLPEYAQASGLRREVGARFEGLIPAPHVIGVMSHPFVGEVPGRCMAGA